MTILDFVTRRTLILLASFGLAQGVASAQALAEVKNVYLLPMPAGLEQYLALQLTDTGAMQVVTDPKKADAILTDRIGGDFEQRLQELYPKEVPEADAKNAGKAGSTEFAPQHMRPLSRSHGAVFLVDRQSGNVLWSTSELPKSTRPADLKHSAERVVSRLAEAQNKVRKSK